MKEDKSFVFRFADMEVREREFTLIKSSKVLTVEPKAFRALVFLLHSPQRLISKEELLNAVWGDVAVADGSLTRCIWLLRRLLEDDINNPRYIATVATVGYKFVCPVEVSEDTHDGDSSEPAHSGSEAGGVTTHTKPRVVDMRNLLQWWLLGAGVIVIGLVAAIWYLRRSLPQPRISAYTQLTHDGHQRWLTGVDQSRIYVNSFAGGPIYQVGIEGGDMVPVPIAVPGGSPMAEDASPDGSHLLVISEENGKPVGTLWNVRIPDGSYRRLGYALDAAFSPDGSSVAYSTPEGDIWLVQSDGTGAHKLGAVGGSASWPVWSPDGRVIRFNMHGRLWEISSNGSNLHEVLPGWHGSHYICCGHWTPDGRFYLFVGKEPLIGGQIWALDERHGLLRTLSTEPVQLTTGPIDWDAPFPGKDGRKIFAYGSTLRGELSRIDPDGKALKPFLGGISADNVSFSKDGQFVAYVSYPGGSLWKANRDGSKPMQLTDPLTASGEPRWSPDGSQILFLGGSSLRNIAYTVPSEGGTPEPILPEDKRSESDPNWSPDGRRIVFGHGDDGDSKSFLSILDTASHIVTEVPESVGTFSPRWSPDGKFIAALSHYTTDLKVFDIEKQRWSTLSMKGGVGRLSFSRDSHYIYFVLSDESNPEALRIFRIPVKGGDVELVVDLKGWRFTGSNWAWMDLDPTDAPLMMRDAGSKDIYALTLEEK